MSFEQLKKKEQHKKSYPKYWDEKIETLPRKELEALQLELLKDMVAHAYHNSPYYHRIFNEQGINPDTIQTLDDIKKFPFTNKKIIRKCQDEAPPFGTMVSVPEEEIVYISASSGSTGSPTASPFTQKDFDDWIDFESRIFWSSGMRPTDRYCHALNFSMFVGGPCVYGAQKLGALSIHAGTIPSERLLALMQQFQPTVIWTTPSYAWYLGETAQKKGIDPAKDLNIKKIFVCGEPGGSIEVTRRRIENLWDADVYDYYGISDIFGSCAAECEEKSGCHFAEDQILVEIINPETGEHVADGERGELVLTTLKKQARPLIRFRTGDIVSYTTETCKCGRTSLRIDGVHGRVDDMLIIKGVNVFPSDIEHITRRYHDLTGEYRLVVDRINHLDTLTVEVEYVEGYTGNLEELAQTVQTDIKKSIAISAKVSILKPDTLPRVTHKAKRILDNRGNVWGR